MWFLAYIAVGLAYLIKGFSGFGPALVLIPSLTLLYNPASAISISTSLDLFAGLILLFTVLKKIDWFFVFRISLLLFSGAYFGAALLASLSGELLSRIIGIGMIVFIALLLKTREEEHHKPVHKKRYLLEYPMVIASGFIGGLTGFSGPLLVLYMKFRHSKDYFRSQLIAIFTLEAGWRVLLYRINNITIEIPRIHQIIMFLIMIGFLFIGQHLHFRVNEQNFNRVIAMILFIPALQLLFFS